MSQIPDQSAFVSRLQLKGTLTFESAVRIGASRSTAVDEPDLPVLRTADGRPYIPGSSLKGALRSHIESVLRTLQANPQVVDHNLACLSVGKSPSRLENGSEPGVCLHQDEVSRLKEIKPGKWHSSNLDGALQARLPGHAQILEAVRQHAEQAVLDQTLRDLSCWCCRVLGSSWLASKVYIKDMLPVDESLTQAEIRDGVGIDRDSGRAADGAKYQFEVVPVGATFGLNLLVQNASEAELGLLWIGLNAFEQGRVLLGGAKSRGLGWCKLTQWTESSYVTAQTLLDHLMSDASAGAGRINVQEQSRQWIKTFFEVIGARSGGNHA